MSRPDATEERGFQRNVLAVIPVWSDPNGLVKHEGISYSRAVTPEERTDINFLYVTHESLGLREDVSVTGKVKGELYALSPIRIPFSLVSSATTSGQPITIPANVIEAHIDQRIPDKNTSVYYTIFWITEEGKPPSAELIVYQRTDPRMSLPVPGQPALRQLPRFYGLA